MATGAPIPVRQYASADEMRRDAAALRDRMFAVKPVRVTLPKPVNVPRKPAASKAGPELQVEDKGFIPPKPLRPEDFQDQPSIPMKRLISMAAFVTGVSALDIVCHRRRPYQVKARQIVYWLGKNYTALSLPQISARVGGRDHTSALHGIRKVQAVVDRLDVGMPVCPIAATELLWSLDWMKAQP